MKNENAGFMLAGISNLFLWLGSVDWELAASIASQTAAICAGVSAVALNIKNLINTKKIDK
jgi:uncharacterized protein (DUF2342 family)